MLFRSGNSESDADVSAEIQQRAKERVGRRHKLFEGSLQVKEHRYEKWKAKDLATESDAEFDNDDIRHAGHSLINMCASYPPEQRLWTITKYRQYYHLKNALRLCLDDAMWTAGTVRFSCYD